MPVRIYTTNAGTDLSVTEVELLGKLVARQGRAVLLAPSFAELDLCRHDAAAAGVSLGVDYKTPSSWLRSPPRCQKQQNKSCQTYSFASKSYFLHFSTP